MSRYWQFTQLSEKYRRLKPMDQIPAAGKLFIGGLKALDAPNRLEEASITHILSVLEFDCCNWEEFSQYKRLLIQADDIPRENLLQYFQRTNSFIEDGLREDGAVIVHCAMGVSRSATICCAYLMNKFSLSPEEALEMARKARPLCNPNDGFLEQLKVYHRILTASSEADASQIYADWFNKEAGSSKI
jgi:dual specificity phosphatase 12